MTKEENLRREQQREYEKVTGTVKIPSQINELQG